MSRTPHESPVGPRSAVQIVPIHTAPSFTDARDGWWGYRVEVAGRPPFETWVLGADYGTLGDGYVQREAVDERLGDGRSPFECDDPHPDIYYDDLWNRVIADLHRSGHPSL